MKIKSVTLKDYGPICDISIIPGNFEVIFGLNESGKTAIVEALSSVLFQKRADTLRYGKPATINVTIESAGKSYNLPAKKSGRELPTGEIANLLYVQASESEIYSTTGSSSFWDALKLMLSQTNQNVSFAKLGEKIFESVGLMPKKVEWNKEQQTIIGNETRRRDELGVYLGEIGEIEKKRAELASLSEKYERLKNELKAIENYKNYKIYIELKNGHNKYLDLKNSLSEYERYDEKYYEHWQRLESDKKSHKSFDTKLKETEEEIKSLSKVLSELQKKDEIIKREDFESYPAKIKEPTTPPSMFYSALMFLLGLLSLILSFRFKFTLLVPISIFALSVVGYIVYSYKKMTLKKSSYEREMLIERARLLFPEIKDLNEIPEKIDMVKNEKVKIATSINEKNAFLKTLSSEKTVEKIDQEINDLRNKTGLAELGQLKDKLDKTRQIKDEISTINARIFGLLHEKDDSKWDRLIKAMKTEMPGKEMDLSLEREIKENLERIKENIERLEMETGVFEEAKRKRYNITDDRQAFIDFNDLQRKLAEYELAKESAIKSRQILNEMSGELDDFIENIVKGENSLSDYFQLVTNRYKNVVVKNRDFIAVDEGGKEFSYNELSSGAQDQLLLCFRLATLNKLYSKGTFLILDDAFIFADWQRRQRLVQLLKKFSAKGNQVLYFTSDDHTRDLFKEYGAQITTI